MTKFTFVVLGFSQKKIIDFFRIQKCSDDKDKCASPQGKSLVHYGDGVGSHCLSFDLFKAL